MVAIRAIPLALGLFVLGATLATRLGTNDSGAAVSSTLHGSVGPGFDISLTYDDGSAVTSPPAGSYRVIVNDVTAEHNFDLIGPGVQMSTGTEQVGTVTWNVTFQNNAQYIFQCDTHPAEMNGIFTVGTVKTSTTTPTTTVPTHPTPVLGTLTGSVSSVAARLTFAGKRPASLKTGSYRLMITDSSAKAAFELQHVGSVAKSLTTKAFVGKHTVVIKLTAGKWKVYSSAHAASAVLFTAK